ncbi:MAG: hypothetical protein J6U75_03085 [Clostridia bacterium]|nr:hypothetical protein [Clostridia bacterium]
MYGGACTAIVPYVPVKAKRSVLTGVFAKRSDLYVFTFCFMCVFVFASYALCSRFGLRFFALGSDTHELMRTHLKAVLLLYISGFTVFSPVLYMLALCAYSLYFGFVSYVSLPFAYNMALCAFMFVTALYLCEVCLCFDKAKYGIRQIFAPRRVFAFSALTLAYLLISLLFFDINIFSQV